MVNPTTLNIPIPGAIHSNNKNLFTYLAKNKTILLKSLL